MVMLLYMLNKKTKTVSTVLEVYQLLCVSVCVYAYLRSDRLLEHCSIALVGKYTKFSDSYASVIKALEHSALAINHKLQVKVGRPTPPWTTTAGNALQGRLAWCQRNRCIPAQQPYHCHLSGDKAVLHSRVGLVYICGEICQRLLLCDCLFSRSTKAVSSSTHYK